MKNIFLFAAAILAVSCASQKHHIVYYDIYDKGPVAETEYAILIIPSEIFVRTIDDVSFASQFTHHKEFSDSVNYAYFFIKAGKHKIATDFFEVQVQSVETPNEKILPVITFDFLAAGVYRLSYEIDPANLIYTADIKQLDQPLPQWWTNKKVIKK
ncbi:MAG: hypothetical protein Ta2F_07730 [Termitinemataceae bacterium]|nr:MAG: hypothetical protein Ta2F_07730 [Termitinemataceae bacterium]